MQGKKNLLTGSIWLPAHHLYINKIDHSVIHSFSGWYSEQMKGIIRGTAFLGVVCTIQVQIAGTVTSKSPITIALIEVFFKVIITNESYHVIHTKEKMYSIIEFVISEEEYGLTHPGRCLPISHAFPCFSSISVFPAFVEWIIDA